MDTEQFEHAAQQLRDAWGIGAPPDWDKARLALPKEACLRWRTKPGAPEGTDQLLLELHASEIDALCAARNPLPETQNVHMAVILERAPSGYMQAVSP